MESASSRAPIEIWRQILLYATHWDPIPAENESELRKLSFFVRGCAIFHQYEKAVVCRTKLRLVNQAWSAMLKDPVPGFALIDADREFWPCYEAVKTAYCIDSGMITDYCWCNPILPVFLRVFDSRELMKKPRLGYSGQVQARICLGEGSRRSTENIFERAPHLEALTWTTRNPSKEAVDSFQFFPRLPLSHLRLVISYDLYMLLNGNYEFPYLRHLEFKFSKARGRWEPTEGTRTWNLPKLSILRVNGHLSQEAKNCIEALIFNARNTLTSVTISCDYFENGSEWTIYDEYPSTLDSIHHLSLFGLEISWFMKDRMGEIPGPNPSTPREVPMTAYLRHFRPAVYFNNRHTSVACAKRLLEWCGRFTCGIKLAMSETWDGVVNPLIGDKKIYHNAMIGFFTEIIAADIPFYDENEVRLGDEATAFFIEGLKTGEFPRHYISPM